MIRLHLNKPIFSENSELGNIIVSKKSLLSKNAHKWLHGWQELNCFAHCLKVDEWILDLLYLLQHTFGSSSAAFVTFADHSEPGIFGSLTPCNVSNGDHALRPRNAGNNVQSVSVSCSCMLNQLTFSHCWFTVMIDVAKIWTSFECSTTKVQAGETGFVLRFWTAV